MDQHISNISNAMHIRSPQFYSQYFGAIANSKDLLFNIQQIETNHFKFGAILEFMDTFLFFSEIDISFCSIKSALHCMAQRLDVFKLHRRI